MKIVAHGKSGNKQYDKYFKCSCGCVFEATYLEYKKRCYAEIIETGIDKPYKCKCPECGEAAYAY